MNPQWYPNKVLVGPEGTRTTYEFMERVFTRDRHFVDAEFGFYLAAPTPSPSMRRRARSASGVDDGAPH